MKIHQPPPPPRTGQTGKHEAFRPHAERPAGHPRSDGFDVPKKQLVALVTGLEKVLGGTAPASGVGATQGTSTDSTAAFKELIDQDMQTAYGRPATQSDYDYWLPKLQGPNDSGFITSGQMSATEYWHRRMLGWQAGGSDQATSGPYAGSSDARGPVPAATDIVGQLV